MNPKSAEPIEDYLDELLSQVRAPARETRRLLAEAETHLHEKAASFTLQGFDPVEAEREAVLQFGSPTEIASAERRALRPTPGRAVVAGGQALTLLAGLGLTAIGISGLLAWAINSLAGPRFVGALPESYSAHLCRSYLLIHPTAATCQQAATWETSSDAVSLRLLPGIFGIALLGAFWVWRRTDKPTGPLAHLDAAAVGLAALGFGAAAIFLTGASIDIAVQHGSGGVGWYLTGSVVAAIAATPCMISTWHALKPLMETGLTPSRPGVRAPLR